MFPDVMLTGPSVIDIDIEICKGLDDLNIVTIDGHREPGRKEALVV